MLQFLIQFQMVAKEGKKIEDYFYIHSHVLFIFFIINLFLIIKIYFYTIFFLPLYLFFFPSCFPSSRDSIEKVVLEKVKEEMKSKVGKFIPGIEGDCKIVLHRWRYSQVSQPFLPSDSKSIYKNAVNVQDGEIKNSPLILAGDGFSQKGSGFESCFESAIDVVKILSANKGYNFYFCHFNLLFLFIQ